MTQCPVISYTIAMTIDTFKSNLVKLCSSSNRYTASNVNILLLSRTICI